MYLLPFSNPLPTHRVIYCQQAQPGEGGARGISAPCHYFVLRSWKDGKETQQICDKSCRLCGCSKQISIHVLNVNRDKLQLDMAPPLSKLGVH